MRKQTQQPRAALRDAPGGDLPDRDETGAFCFPGRGLCCPDDPLDLALQLFPAHAAADDRAPPSSLAALGIGGAGAEPPRHDQEQEQEQEQPQPLAESAFGGVGGRWDSWGLSGSVLEELRGLEEIDVDMFFADDAPDGAEATEGNLLCDPTETKPEPAAHLTHTAGGGHVHTPGSRGGAVPNDASPPLPPPMPAGAFPLQAYHACHAFDATVFNNVSAPPPPPMPAGGPLPVAVTRNSTPTLPVLMAPAAAAPPPPPMPAGDPLPVVVTRNSTPTLPALMSPAPPEPMPAAASLHACRSMPSTVSNGAPAPPPLPPATTVPMPAGGPPPVFVTNNSTLPLLALMPAAPAPMPPDAGLHACGALPGIVSNGAPAPPPPLMAPMPARAVHPMAALAGVYSISNPKLPSSPPSAALSSSPPSGASSGSGRCPSSTTTSEPEFLQPHHAWVVVPTKQRSPPAVNRRKRPWQLDFPLHALPPAALAPHQANPGGDDDDDAKNRYALVPVALAPPGGNTGGDDIAAVSGGGVRRRRPAPRQRNRQAQRVCSHCQSPETPQWRAGPDGPGTLCNACGIRYAANRLLPEYRPSTAPSFRSGQHSNRHRKVMKLREHQMKAKEEKPPSEQRPMEDGADEKDDGFMGVCAYISAAGL